MDIFELQKHFTGTRVFSDVRGLRLAVDNAVFDLGIVHWSSAPEDSIAALTRSDSERVVYFVVRDFEARSAEIVQAIAGSEGAGWVGTARARHAHLVEQAQAAMRMAMVVALRRWRGATVETGVVRDGTAALEFQTKPDATLVIVGRLGTDALFSVQTPIALAPAVACRAVAALDAGQVLDAPEELEALVTAQARFRETWGLASNDTCDACAAGVTS